MAKTPSSTLATVPVPEPGSLTTGAGMSMSIDIDGGNSVAEPKTDIWASLSASQASLHSQGSFKKSGWATIGPSPSSNPLTPSTSAINRQPPSAQTALSSPTFRNAGWSSLDTGSSQPFPVTNQTETNGSSSRDEFGSGQRWQGFTEPTESPPPPLSELGALQSLPPMPPVPPTIPKAIPARSNWQQFQKGASRRK
jgi:hypothetical protein